MMYKITNENVAITKKKDLATLERITGHAFLVFHYLSL